MAMIIQLDRVTDSAQDVGGGDDGRQRKAAEVILFPGVRYERWADKAQQSAAKAGVDTEVTQVPPRRDWLDI